MTTKSLLEEALKLPPRRRAALVEKLLESLDQPILITDAIKEGLDESLRRKLAYEQGLIKAKPAEEALASIGKKKSRR